MKVIMADDEEVTQLLVVEKLKSWGYEVLSASNGLEVLELYEKHDDVQLFLLDWQMPKLDGINLCRRLKVLSPIRCCYIIILTGKKKPENVVTALESGADDFVSKPFSPEELKVRLSVGCRVIENENRLLQLAQQDPLTKTMNHRTLMEELNKLWQRTKRDGSPLCVMMVDIDHFKNVNDTYGHPMGDYALNQFCDIVKHEIRPYDSFGRYGGEEFTLVLPATDIPQAMLVAERIRERVANTPIEKGDVKFSITISIGLTQFSENQRSHKEMIMSADRAVYLAKNNGRNRIEVITD